MANLKTILNGLWAHRVLLCPRYLSYYLRYKDRLPRERRPAHSRGTALREAILWLCRSQEAGSDEGSSCFRLRDGWSAGYPEVTGYNLYTLLKYHERTGDKSAYDHAIRMADWELTVQLEDGAFQGGYLGGKAKPVVFNTAQAMQGLLKAFQATQNQHYYDAALRAADWLVGCQDQDGAWRKHVYLGEFRVTDTRVAYPLLEMWQVCHDDRYRQAALRSLRYAIGLQTENGWLPLCDNSREHIDQPLTHTLSYTCEGLIKSGLLLQDESILRAGQLTSQKMLRRFEVDKVLYGRYDCHWKHTVPWVCVTGNAQISEVWSILFLHTNDPVYLNAAIRMNDYLCACQDVKVSHPGLRGAISGSEPLSGGYQAFTFPSWATKYFCDALMAEEDARQKAGVAEKQEHPEYIR
jgi:rhamnogalacturonyl hydrolase YesR